MWVNISAVDVTLLLLALVVIYSTSSPHVITCANRTPPCLPQYRTECWIKSMSVFCQEHIFSLSTFSSLDSWSKHLFYFVNWLCLESLPCLLKHHQTKYVLIQTPPNVPFLSISPRQYLQVTVAITAVFFHLFLSYQQPRSHIGHFGKVLPGC